MEKRKPRADGIYRIGIYLGKVNGKPKYKYVYDADPKVAERKADDIRVRMKKGLDVTAERETFGAWVDRWLTIKRSEVGPSQYRCCKGFARHFDPLYHVPISKISAFDVQEIISQLATINPHTGKPTAKRTLKCIKSTASQVIQLAIDNRVIDYNPVQAVKIPKSASEDVRRALSEEEQKWIINTPHRMQTAAMIMMLAGLRRGELVPLLWDDIDLQARTITVNKSTDMSHGKTIIKSGAKTKAGARTIDIPKKLVRYLQGLSNRDGLVCPGMSGHVYTSAYWRSSWDSYVLHLDMMHGENKERKSRFDPRFKGVSIERITPHMLRHTFCTMLYFAGVDVLTAQQQMGHSDAKTTLGIYTHLDSTHKRRQMSKLDEYLENG